jgi:hypothetical protein
MAFTLSLFLPSNSLEARSIGKTKYDGFDWPVPFMGLSGFRRFGVQ